MLNLSYLMLLRTLRIYLVSLRGLQYPLSLQIERDIFETMFRLGLFTV